jgi:hypothetical protein
MAEAAVSSSFVKVGSNAYYRFAEEQKEAFMQWWNATSYGRAHQKEGNPTFGSKARKRTYWDNYDECAKITSGEPAIICIDCGPLYPHLNKKNTGNRAMHDHLACCPKRKTGTGSGSTQARLTDLIIRVSVSFIVTQSVLTDHHYGCAVTCRILKRGI